MTKQETCYDTIANIKNGADRIIVGRPITQAKNPYDAVMRTLDEIVNVAK